MARQPAAAGAQLLIRHLTFLSPGKTALGQVLTSAGLIHSQGSWSPRRHLFQTWPPLGNKNPSSLPLKPCTLGLCLL